MYTGERILPGSVFNVTLQQSKKAYEFVADLGKQKTILDVACGEGYGTALLGSAATRVVGADKDSAAIAQARQKYAGVNVTYIQSDLFALPAVMTQTFDIVCCFQTIEHLDNQDDFLATLKQLASPGGKVIISTPNKHRFPAYNPYHVRELDESRLRELFARHFTHFEILGVHASPRVLAYRATKDTLGQIVLRFDIFNLRNRLPRRLVQVIYSFISYYIIKRLSWRRHRQAVANVTSDDFTIAPTLLDKALDFIVVAEVSH